jgi:hypothetical protein
MPVFYPSPLANFPKEKYKQSKIEYTILKKIPKKFCGKSRIQSCLSDTKYRRHSLEHLFSIFLLPGTFSQFRRFDHFAYFGHL